MTALLEAPEAPLTARSVQKTRLTRTGTVASSYEQSDLRPIHLLHQAGEVPDKTFMWITAMEVGTKVGWLTILGFSDGRAVWSRVLVRCRCGAVTFPELGNVSKGTTRSCGLVDLHGIGI